MTGVQTCALLIYLTIYNKLLYYTPIDRIYLSDYSKFYLNHFSESFKRIINLLNERTLTREQLRSQVWHSNDTILLIRDLYNDNTISFESYRLIQLLNDINVNE